MGEELTTKATKATKKRKGYCHRWEIRCTRIRAALFIGMHLPLHLWQFFFGHFD